MSHHTKAFRVTRKKEEHQNEQKSGNVGKGFLPKAAVKLKPACRGHHAGDDRL